MAAIKGVRQHADEIVRRLESGESLQAIADRLGCTREPIRRIAVERGVKSKHPAKAPGKIWIEEGDETITLHAFAKRYGIPYKIAYQRWQRGDRGERLRRPHKRHASPPPCYQCGVSLAQWRLYAEAAREVGPLTISNRTGLPYGAISAAVRGEWDRLG